MYSRGRISETCGCGQGGAARPEAPNVGCAEFGPACICEKGWACGYDGCGVVGADGGGREGTVRRRVWARKRFCEMEDAVVAYAAIPKGGGGGAGVGAGGREEDKRVRDVRRRGGEWPKLRGVMGVYLYGITVL
jgi:hypothetical protein